VFEEKEGGKVEVRASVWGEEEGENS